MYSKTSLSASLIGLTLAALTHAGELDKPPLAPNLDYLADGLMNNFPSAGHSIKQWDQGWIPKDCKNEAEEAGHSAADVSTYEVSYEDCNTAWVMCYHKDAGQSFDDFVELFGRVPVAARQYVRHVIALPDSGPHAYNAGGNIAMFAPQPGGLGFEVFMHETGHSLDLLGAYTGGQLSTSQNWLDNYNQDPNVPDPYSQTNQIENVAQNTVVAAYNVQVPGGFGSLEPKWQNIFHQYATVQTWQRESGNLLVPGGQCSHRLTNSETVPIDGSSSRRMARREERAARKALAARKSEKPGVSLGEGIEVIPPKDFHTGKKLVVRGKKPDVSLGKGIQVIPPKDFHTRDICSGKHKY
ncbi:MAG: hypothetical protein Q9201_003602 [Fulgogasparrea decipioides]